MIKDKIIDMNNDINTFDAFVILLLKFVVSLGYPVIAIFAINAASNNNFNELIFSPLRLIF